MSEKSESGGGNREQSRPDPQLPTEPDGHRFSVEPPTYEVFEKGDPTETEHKVIKLSGHDRDES